MAKNRPKKEAKTDPKKGVKNGVSNRAKVGKFSFSGKVGFCRIWEVVFEVAFWSKMVKNRGPEIPKSRKMVKNGQKSGFE
jgi:hypothetical protein